MAFDWIREAAALRERGTPFALVTVLETRGSAPRAAGTRMIVLPDTIAGTIGGGHLEQAAIEEARALLAAGTRAPVRRDLSLGASLGQCCGGRVDLLIEPVRPPVPVILFGAGHVAQAIAHVLGPTDLSVTVVDPRPEFARGDRLPGADRVILGDPLDALDDLPWHEDTFALVLTHSHGLDQDLIEALVRRPARYLGLVGSRTKWNRFRNRLRARGVSEAELARVTCPIGLAGVGGRAPADIAIAVAAQVMALARGAEAACGDAPAAAGAPAGPDAADRAG